MKVLYTSDLHGEIHLCQELLSLVMSNSIEIVMIGGDLLPSFPPTKRYEDMVPNQKTFIAQFLLPFYNRMLGTTSVQQIFLISGNWDLGYPYLFKEPAKGIVDLNQRSIRLENGYEFIGYPFVPPTPFRPKDYEKMDDRESPWPPQKNPSYIRSSDQLDQLTPIDPYLYLRGQGTIEEDLDRFPKPLIPKKTVYIMHSPPFGTRLDLIQGGKSAGSRSIKTFIEKNQPLLTLHGHIHEAPELSGAFMDQIGETLSVNPGQFSWAGRDASRLHAVTFEIENIKETLKHTCY
ncbi:MAG: metallophosphoesterase family protein [Syntrophaceae bacterium]|nr:metallophosphoesterase family protein [Syntrophaceae bacterium]